MLRYDRLSSIRKNKLTCSFYSDLANRRVANIQHTNKTNYLKKLIIAHRSRLSSKLTRNALISLTRLSYLIKYTRFLVLIKRITA